MALPTSGALAHAMLLMDRPQPAGVPGPQQLRIPTPQDLVRMRQLRQQQQARQRHQPREHVPPQRQQPMPPPSQLQQREQQQQETQQLQQRLPQSQQPPPAQQQHQHQHEEQNLWGPQWRLGATQQQQPGLKVQQQAALQRQGLLQKQARLPSRGGGRDDLFSQLAQECKLEDGWRPQVLLLHELGMREADFQRLTESRPEIFQMGIVTMRRRLKFFQDTIGLSNGDLTKVIAKFPRILEYKSERTIRPRLDFLRRCGVEQEDLAKVFTRAPMAMELRVKDTLEPRAAFLRDVLCLSPGALGKLIVRHPQVLTCTEEMMQLRVDFLLRQGLNQEEVGRAVLAHPQVLHYKIDSMQERISYLLSIGLDQAQVAACIFRFPQLISLNVEANLAPKWRYLVDYIRAPADGVAILCAYPAYFSLSLINRVVPRHRYFLHVHSKRQRRGNSKGAAGSTSQAFPMSHLKCSDTQFAKFCGTPLEDYEQFKAQLFGGKVVTALHPPA